MASNCQHYTNVIAYKHDWCLLSFQFKKRKRVTMTNILLLLKYHKRNYFKIIKKHQRQSTLSCHFLKNHVSSNELVFKWPNVLL